MSEYTEDAWSEARQTASLLLEAQQALAQARQITDDPAVLVCLLRIEQCLLRIGLLKQPPDQGSSGSTT